MTDETNTPDEQDTSSQQQGGTPEGFVKKERFTGLVQKVETLNSTLEEAQGSLAEKSSKITELQGQLEELQGTHEISLSEKETTLTELQEELGKKDKSLAALQALELKMKMAKEMGRGDLLPVLEHIPNSTDEEAVKASLQAFAKLADDAAKNREEQLRLGITDTPEGDQENPGQPTTRQAWLEHIQSTTPGTPDRTEAMNNYATFMRSQDAQ